jgi:RNA polymerase sigma factor (sigma-70 family)
MTEISSTREARRSRFVRRYLVLAPKVTLATRKRLSIDADAATDLIQELLVGVLEQIESSDRLLRVEELSDDELLRYLAQAVRNRLIDRKRRDDFIRRSYKELLLAMEPAPTPEELLMDSERMSLLRQSVAALRPPYRDLLQALLEENMTLAKLAMHRKIKIGTIYTQFHRAVTLLGDEWGRRTKVTGALPGKPGDH